VTVVDDRPARRVRYGERIELLVSPTLRRGVERLASDQGVTMSETIRGLLVDALAAREGCRDG